MNAKYLFAYISGCKLNNENPKPNELYKYRSYAVLCEINGWEINWRGFTAFRNLLGKAKFSPYADYVKVELAG